MMNGKITQCGFLELNIVGMNGFDWQNFYVNEAWAWLVSLNMNEAQGSLEKLEHEQGLGLIGKA